ncbi:MAG: hypothetical protein CMJ58_16295 [Planctomycetaceae bacterium]|nr:hypothetical protein [Planctomycetaceae bacterium]
MKSLWHAFLGVSLWIGCSNDIPTTMDSRSTWIAGGVYSIDSGDGIFKVVKILVLEPGIVHARIYKNKFQERPESVDFESLSLGSVHDADGFGMGHLPLSEATFRSWTPAFVTRADVTDDELEGYCMWKDADGGVF